MTSGSNDVPRATFQKELHSFIEKMSEIDFFLPEHGLGAAANCCKLAALKRQVEEKCKEVERWGRLMKKTEVECQNVNEKLLKEQVDRDAAIAETGRLKNRVNTLNDLLDHNLEENEMLASCQKERDGQHVLALRKHLEVLRHENDAMKLERDLTEVNLNNVSRWKKNTNTSE